MNHLRKAKMNSDVAWLVLEYPELAERLDPEYRVELFKFYSVGIDSEPMNKTEEMAALYLLAKKFKVTQPMKPIAEILQISNTTASRRISMARDNGLVLKITKQLEHDLTNGEDNEAE